jgi:Na+/melibiose symporter-like transporter
VFLKRNPVLVKALAFVFIVSSSPTSGDAFTYFQSDVLGFTPAFLSWTTVIQAGANLAAAYAYTTCWRTACDVRTVFRYAIASAALVGLLNVVVVERWNVAAGIPDKLFVVGDTIGQGVAAEIVFMPVAVMAAHLAPPGREGTAYAIAMSVLNVAWACSELLSGILSRALGIVDGNYANLSLLMLVVAMATLLPLLVLRFVPELSPMSLGNGRGPVERENASHDDHHERQDLLDRGGDERRELDLAVI